MGRIWSANIYQPTQRMSISSEWHVTPMYSTARYYNGATCKFQVLVLFQRGRYACRASCHSDKNGMRQEMIKKQPCLQQFNYTVKYLPMQQQLQPQQLAAGMQQISTGLISHSQYSCQFQACRCLCSSQSALNSAGYNTVEADSNNQA